MSSAILYAAIVAIWIGVLVPRWLRHDYTYDSHLRLRRSSSQLGPQADTGDADARVFSQDGRPQYTSFGGPGTAQPGQNAARAGQHGPDERPWIDVFDTEHVRTTWWWHLSIYQEAFC